MVRGDAVAGSVTQQERDAKVRQLVVDLGDGLHSNISFKERECEPSQFVAGRAEPFRDWAVNGADTVTDLQDGEARRDAEFARVGLWILCETDEKERIANPGQLRIANTDTMGASERERRRENSTVKLFLDRRVLRILALVGTRER